MKLNLGKKMRSDYLPEIHECWHFVDIVDFRRLWIVILDEINPEGVGFIVNQLKNLENRFAFNAVLVV